MTEDYQFIRPFSDHPAPLAPTHHGRNEIVEHLFAKKMISISPDSPISGFVFDEELTKCEAYYPTDVNWIFFPDLHVQEKQRYLQALEKLVTAESWPASWKEEFVATWRRIAKLECLEYFAFQIEQRDFPVAAFGPKTHAVFDQLMDSFSIGQIFNLTWQSVRDATDYIRRERLPSYRAKNMFINILHRKMDRAKVEKWEPRASRRDFKCPQSVISATFFSIFTNIGSEVLEVQIPSA